MNCRGPTVCIVTQPAVCQASWRMSLSRQFRATPRKFSFPFKVETIRVRKFVLLTLSMPGRNGCIEEGRTRAHRHQTEAEEHNLGERLLALIVKDDIQKRTMNLQSTGGVIVDEAQL